MANKKYATKEEREQARKEREEQKKKLEKQYKYQLRRLNKIINEALSLGFDVSANIIPARPKSIGEGTIRRLKKITPTTVYKKSIGYIDGYATKGEVAIKEIRARQRAEKKQQKAVKPIEQIDNTEAERQSAKEEFYKFQQEAFEKSRKLIDEQQKQRLKKDEDYRQRFNNGKIALDTIRDAIDTVDIDYKDSARLLNNLLNLEIKNYTEEKVILNLGNAPKDKIEKALDVALNYRVGSPQNHNATSELYELITGEIMSSDVARKIEDTADEGDTEW